MPCTQAPITLQAELRNEQNIAMSHCTPLRHLQKGTRAGNLQSWCNGSGSSGHGVTGDGPDLCSWSSILYYGVSELPSTVRAWDKDSVSAVVSAG